MTTEFTHLNLLPQLEQAVSERGYLTPTPIQASVIPAMLAGKDVIGQAQTGTGKTAAFALPMLQTLTPDDFQVQGLVLTPTRELAMQVADAFQSYGQFCDVRVTAVYGGQAYGPQIGRIKRGVHVVVGTPGRLLDLIRKNILKLESIRTLVLDEADEMLNMGFIEDIEAILSETPASRQTALFSATLPTRIRRLAERYMRDPQAISIQSEKLTVSTTAQRYYLMHDSDKLAALTRLFEIEEINSAIIFVRTRAGTGQLANELTVRGFPAEALNGDLSQDTRESILGRFRNNQIKVLVATDVAARGLDIDDISHVFNYDLPDDPEIYVHRIGRTGRAGKSGIAISLITPTEKHRLRMIEGFTRQKVEFAHVPTDENIRIHREQILMKQVGVWLQRSRYKRERELVAELIELGHDPAEIAAAALKVARAEEKQRPVYPISAILEPDPPKQPRQSRNRQADQHEPKSRRNGKSPVISHEVGMVRLSLNLGRNHGVRPNDIVGVIAYHADIPGSAIGKISIQDKYSLVDVPEEFVSKVLAKTGDGFFRKQPIALQRA